MSRRQRMKGKRGELEAAALLRAVFPAVRRRCAGEESQDARPRRDLAGTPGWCVQVCLAARPPIARKFGEALAAAGAGEAPLALTRGQQGEWLATLLASDLLELLRRPRGPAPEAPA